MVIIYYEEVASDGSLMLFFTRWREKYLPVTAIMGKSG